MPKMQTLPYDATKIRDLRKRANLSLAQLGERTGHHPQSLRNIELRRKNASVETLTRIAAGLGVDLDDITLTEEEAGAPMQVAS